MWRIINFKSYWLLTLLLGVLGLYSCADYDSEPQYPAPGEVSEFTLYLPIRLNLTSEASTRAPWDSDDDKASSLYDKGLTQEAAIYFPDTTSSDGSEEEEEEEEENNSDNHHFIFVFDASGNLVGNMAPINNFVKNTSDTSPYYDSYVGIRIVDDKEENYVGKKMSGWQIFSVVNASDNLINELTKVKTISALKALTAGTSSISLADCLFFTKDNTTYFTMTSSMVVKDNTVVPATEGSIIFYPSEEKARAGLHQTLYVERLPAKYTVVFKNQDNEEVFLIPSPRPSGDEVNEDDLQTVANDGPQPVSHLLFIKEKGTGNAPLKIVTEYSRSSSMSERAPLDIKEPDSWMANIIGWGINADTGNEYLYKNLSPSTSYYTGWQPLSYRNFWAEDPSYSSSNYPEQERVAFKDFSVQNSEDGVTIIANKDNTVKDCESTILNPPVAYHSFLQLSERNPRQYLPEHTFSGETVAALDNDPFIAQTYLRAGSHLVVTAQLLIKGIDSNYLFDNLRYDESSGLLIDQGNAPAASKYLMNDIYWSEQAYKEYVAEYLAYFMLSEANKEIFGDNDGNFYINKDGVFILAKAENFEIESAYIKGGDNFVFIFPHTQLYIFNPRESDNPETAEDERFHQISELNYLNLAYSHPELMAARYLNGRMYYATGSKHNLESSNFSGGKEVVTGDFGTVRNHWYAFTINEINSPGIGVDIETQPIIPNHTPRNMIDASLRILDWHPIYTSVEVNDQHRPGASGN